MSKEYVWPLKPDEMSGKPWAFVEKKFPLIAQMAKVKHPEAIVFCRRAIWAQQERQRNSLTERARRFVARIKAVLYGR